MTWSAAFIEDLERMPSDPIFVVHFMKPAGSPTNTPGKDELKLASSGEYGDVVGIGMELQISGSLLRPVEWSYTTGTASVSFIADTANPVTGIVRRGQVTRIMMGFAGYSWSDFEPIFLGRVQNIIGAPPQWTISFFDATSLLQTRWTSGSDLGLFEEATQSTVIQTSAYSAGDGTITVSDNTKLTKQSGGVANKGMVKVTPNSGDDFYLTFTGKGSGTITGVSATGQHGTTAAAASAGNAVQCVPFLNGSVFEIYKRVLVSDGSHSSEPNVYPEDWGFGIPEDFVDDADIDAASSAATWGAGNTLQAQIKVEDQQTSPWRWIFDAFLPYGVFPVVRHGKFSMRTVQDPNDPMVTTGITITDRDIVDVIWSAYHPECSVEYAAVSVKSDLNTTPRIHGMVYTFPREDVQLYDASNMLWQYSSSNQTTIRSSILDRVANWGLFIPYGVDVTCAGLRLAQLVPGDIVALTTEHIRATNETEGAFISSPEEEEDYYKRPAMVLGVDVDFVAGIVHLNLAIIPDPDATS